MSVARAFERDDVCSPGSATNFSASNLSKYLTAFKEYSKVVVVLDNDAAGIKGLIECRAAFLHKLPFVDYILLSPDANETLSENGPGALRDQLLRAHRK